MLTRPLKIADRKKVVTLPIRLIAKVIESAKMRQQTS